MGSKELMIASSVVTGFLGFAASFFPYEILNAISLSATVIPTLLVQITGALYLGFAVMNWMARTVIIGGIYARPLSMGNFLHFMVAGIALVKAAINNPGSQFVWIAAVLYSIFAILFGVILFTHPRKK